MHGAYGVRGVPRRGERATDMYLGTFGLAAGLGKYVI